MHAHLIMCKQITDIKLLVLCNCAWNHLTECKQMISGLFKNVIYKLFTNCMYLYV